MSIASLRRKAELFPDSPGVYVMLDRSGREIYVGKAARLKERVRQYFQDPCALDEKTRALVAAAHDITFIQTSSEVEALILESRMIKDLQPKYNVRLKSSDQYALVEICWDEDFPRVLVTRERGHKGSHYFGPFVDVGGLREGLKLIRRAFPFRTCSRDIREDDERRRFVRPCLNYHIKLCSAPCAAKISREAYRADIKRLERFLRGKKDDVLKELRQAMERASKALEFEEAARLRDEMFALESLDRRGRIGDGIEPAPPPIEPREACLELGQTLGLAGPVRSIEGIDLSNLGGGDAVGSLVAFADGMPAKGSYRRFLIRGEATRDDYSMMREVVLRRYGRLLREGLPLPDVVLIDGGLGHLRAAEGALKELGVCGPVLLAIAKDRKSPRHRAQEKVRSLAHPSGISFQKGSAALKLLQYVRDEAHRFAQHYHRLRRRKRLLS